MLVREKASLIVDAWALEAPVLRRNLKLTGGPGLPRDMFPIGPSRPRRRQRERSRRAEPKDIAKCFLNRKRSLLPSSPPPTPGLFDDALNWMADLIERCLEAGKIPELHQEQPLHLNANEGASGSPLLQTMFGSVKNPSKNSSSVKNAGAPSCTGRPKCHWCSSVANSGPIKHSVGRKRNSGEVFMTVEEDDPNRKRQLTELELVTEVEAGSCSANLMAN